MKKTLGQKNSALKNFLDESLFLELDDLNDKRIRLIHSEWSQDESGKIGYSRMRADFKEMKIKEIIELREQAESVEKRLSDIYTKDCC